MAATADIPIDLTARRARRPRQPAAASFDALFRAEHGPLMRIALALTGSAAEAEEVVQEAFLRCHQRWDRVGRYERPGAWLRRVVINLATSRARRARHEVRAMSRLRARSRSTDPDDGLAGDAGAFWAAVRRLPVRQRQAVVLYYGEDLAVADVADVMGCAAGTVRALLHQARTALATLLEDHR